MYRIYTALFAILISFTALAQTSYQNGYFIDSQGKRTECFINEKQWSRDSKTFSYRLDQGNATLGSVRTVKEFGIGEKRFLRFEVQVDNSSSNRDSLKENSAPEWESDTLFLSVLVDSKADLYYCKRNGENRFFFKVDDGPVTQLVHKLYRARSNTQESRIATNNTYKNQLKNDVNCRGYSDERLNALRYDIGVLINFFKQQNECLGGEVAAVNSMDHETLRIKLTPGISFAHAEGYAEGRKYQDYDPGRGFRFGADFEYTLPFHRRKWALLLEPAFQSYSSSGKTNNDLTIKYHSIEVSLGVRHYFFLGKKASIFVNGAAVLDLPTEYQTSYEEHVYSMNTKPICMTAGLGAAFKRLSIEARYYATRTTTGRALITTPFETIIIPLSNDYQKMSIIFGFRLL